MESPDCNDEGRFIHDNVQMAPLGMISPLPRQGALGVSGVSVGVPDVASRAVGVVQQKPRVAHGTLGIIQPIVAQHGLT